MAESILRIGLGKHLDDLGLGEGSAISPLFFVLSECKKDTAKSRAVINCVRIHCYRQGVLHIEHCDRKDAKRRALELSRQGYVITHTEIL